MKKKNIVILGAGFGGMYAYKTLSKKIFESDQITLVDKSNHFLFTPLLHEVATGSLGVNQVVEPIRSLICPKTHFLHSEIVSIDVKQKIVKTKKKNIPYDVLISSLGSRSHYYGVPGSAEYCYTLKSLKDAIRLKNQFIDKFEEASREEDMSRRKKILSFAIVGAGPTGVELAGEAVDLFFKTFEKYYNNFYCFKDVSLILINSNDRVLGMFNEKLGRYASTTLTKNNVIIRNNVKASEIKPQSLVTSEGEEIHAETIIWTAGVAAQPLVLEQGSFHLQKGRILVNEFMKAKGLEDFYVIGDMSFVETESGLSYPMTAQVAKQQGVLVGKNINRELHRKKTKPFKYKERGLLASLGNYDAVAYVEGISFHGFFAWFMWRTVYLMNFISWRKKFKIMLDWTVNLFTERDITHI